MSTPEDLSRSYDEHMRIFEARLDSVGGRTPPKRSSVVLSPQQQGRARSVSKSSGSPTRDRSGSRLSPTPNTAAVRANSQPGEVIIGFAAPAVTSGSPEEVLSRSQERSMSMSALSSPPKLTSSAVVPPSVVPAPTKAAKGAPVAGAAAAASAAASAKGGAADPRGPKVDKKTLTKAERREQAQKEQAKSKARKAAVGKGGGGAAKAEEGGKAAGGGGQQPKQQHEVHRKRSVEKEKPSAMGKATVQAGAAAAGGSATAAAPAGGAAGVAGLLSSPSPRPGSLGSGENSSRVPFLLHLPSYVGSVPRVPAGLQLHPEVVRLGAKYVEGTIRGSAARCVALIAAFKAVVQDFKLPARSEFSKHFAEHLRPMLTFIIDCRPKSVSMGNLIRCFKNKIVECRGKSETEGKQLLLEFLDEFLDERLLTAEQLICDYGTKKIETGDVIITFACSFVVGKLLVAAHAAGKRFRLIIVDSTPLLEGKEFLKRMTLAGINCTYVLLNAVCYMMKEATKVFVGAYAMLSNGNLVSRVGTALVAMAAHEYNVPVIVCCETVKFSTKTMLDSITWNEEGNADDLATPSLSNWRQIPNLTLMSVLYDVTPMEFLTMVICEFGMIPPTSVPVILREYGNKKEDNSER